MCSRFKDTLVNTVGHRMAERALQLGLLFPPAEALRVGIVDQVVPEDQVHSTALSVMAQWLAIPGEGHREGLQVCAPTGEPPPATAGCSGETRAFTPRCSVQVVDVPFIRADLVS